MLLERPGLIVRYKDLILDYLSMVEMICPDVSVQRWKYLFANFTVEDPKFLNECRLAKTLHFEDENSPEKFETSIRVLRFPFVNERAAINTQYNLFNYKGNKNMHLILISSKGNNKFMNKVQLD